MRADQFKLQELFYADQPDTDAIKKQYKKLAELRHQMIDSSLEAHKQLNAVADRRAPRGAIQCSSISHEGGL